MAPRYLNLSHLVCGLYLTTEVMRRRRPRQAARVRAFAANPPRQVVSRSRGPLIPSPRRPIDTMPMQVLAAVLAGLRRWAVAT